MSESIDRPGLTKRVRARLRGTTPEQIIQRWAALALALVLALAGTVGSLIAYSHGTDSKTEALTAINQRVECINDVLRQREKIAGLQHNADVARVKAQRAAEVVIQRGLDGLLHARTPAAKLAAYNTYRHGEVLFAHTLDAYINATNELRKKQLKRPLGKC